MKEEHRESERRWEMVLWNWMCAAESAPFQLTQPGQSQSAGMGIITEGAMLLMPAFVDVSWPKCGFSQKPLYMQVAQGEEPWDKHGS